MMIVQHFIMSYEYVSISLSSEVEFIMDLLLNPHSLCQRFTQFSSYTY